MVQERILFIWLLLWGCAGNSGSSGEHGSGNWPLFRGDAALTGHTAIQIPSTPALLWSYKSMSRTSSSPVVYSKTVYWSDKRGHIYGVNIDGELCFEYRLETAVEATPVICDSVLYIGRIDGKLTALSLTKKDILWNFETMGQISASPNIGIFEGEQAIIFGSYDNNLYCINSRSGKEINRFASGYYINGAVALRKEYVLFGGCDAWLRVVNTVASVVSDSLKLDTYIPASPAIKDDYCYIADHAGSIYELKVENGKITGSKKIMSSKSENSTVVSVPAVDDQTLYILSDDRYIYAIDREDGQIKWRYLQKGDSGESSPVICSDKVISCTKSGIVSILNAETGKLLWEYDTGEQILASPAIIKGHFYILTTQGTLFCFGTKK